MSIFQTDKAKQEALAIDKDINRLADNVTNLHALFKQMNEIVYEQGQMVDRIDFNIESALISIGKGNKELVQVVKI